MALHFASRLSIIAFTTAVIRGLILGLPVFDGIVSALYAGAFFYVVGAFCGDLARRAVEEHVTERFAILVEESLNDTEHSEA